MNKIFVKILVRVRKNVMGADAKGIFQCCLPFFFTPYCINFEGFLPPKQSTFIKKEKHLFQLTSEYFQPFFSIWSMHKEVFFHSFT